MIPDRMTFCPVQSGPVLSGTVGKYDEGCNQKRGKICVETSRKRVSVETLRTEDLYI